MLLYPSQWNSVCMSHKDVLVGMFPAGYRRSLAMLHSRGIASWLRSASVLVLWKDLVDCRTGVLRRREIDVVDYRNLILRSLMLLYPSQWNSVRMSHIDVVVGAIPAGNRRQPALLHSGGIASWLPCWVTLRQLKPGNEFWASCYRSETLDLGECSVGLVRIAYND